MQDLKLKDHFTGLENAGQEKGPKRAGGKQNNRAPDAQKLKIVQLC